MANGYNPNEVMKTLARDLGNFLRQWSKTLRYDKTYTGTIVAKKENIYTIRIKNADYTVKSNFGHTVDSTIRVTAIQNNMNDLIIPVTYNDLVKLIK